MRGRGAALDGRTVLVPDTASTTAGALSALVEAGARPLVVPLIEARPVPDPAPLDAALRAVREGRYRWLALAGAAAVRALDERAGVVFADDPAIANLLGLVAVGQLRVVCVGPATVGALRSLGIEPLVPERGSGPVALIGPLLAAVGDEAVLFARGNLVGPALAGALRRGGVTVDEVVAYVTLRAEDPPPTTVAAWGSGLVDAVLLTSPRAVRGLVDRLGPPQADVLVGCLDRATVGVAVASGLRVDAIGPLPTVPALVRAMETAFAERC